MFHVARKLSTIEEQRQYFFLGGKITGTKATTPKTVLGLSQVNMLGLGIIILPYDIQQYASNDQAYGKLPGNKD
jgi:hypothetical protein